MPKRFWLLTILLPVLPDLDVIAFRFGIPYEHVLGHRGITHSLFFALLTGICVTVLFFRKSGFSQRKLLGLALLFTAITASHGIFDALTNGGKGVAFFAPFDNTRHFFEFRPIRVSPINIQTFLGERGLRVLWSEFLWIVLPISSAGLLTMWLRSKKKGLPQK